MRGDVGERLAERWRDDLADWAIPPEIERAASSSPWALPARSFVRRADQLLAEPDGPSLAVSMRALATPGSVLDVGAGAGAASLPLAGAATGLTAVDTDAGLLAELVARAERLGLPVTTVQGRWPDVAGEVGQADLAVCHHVLYNVPELPEFVAALTARARRLVVCELTDRHPLSALNPLWLRFHDLRRPERPTAADAVELLAALGYDVEVVRWRRARAAEGPEELAERVERARRHLCLPPERTAEVAAAMSELGQREPAELVTVSWPGRGKGPAG